MSLLDRMISTVMALLAMALSAFLIAIAAGWDSLSVVILIERLRTAPWQTAFFAVAILGVALRMLSQAYPEHIERALVRETEFGQVRVAIQAVEQAVLRGVQQMRGVHNADVDVKLLADGVDVRLNLIATADIAIPDLSVEVQEAVAGLVRETIGVSVKNVLVEIAAVTGEVRRVE